MPMPDPKWTKKHLRDVEAMRHWVVVHADDREVKDHPHRKDALEAFGVIGRNCPPDPDLADAMIQALALGFAYSGLKTADEPPPEVWDALRWSAWMDVPGEPEAYFLAMAYSAHVGHFIGRRGFDRLEELGAALDWDSVRAASPRAVVVREAMAAGWVAVGGLLDGPIS